MAVIREDYLFPIYCDNAIPVNDEKNFYATGQDIIDTIEDYDVYVHKAGDTMTGDLILEGGSVGVITNRIDTNNDQGLRITLQQEDWLLLSETLGVLYAYKPLLIDTIHGRTGTTVSFANDRIVDVQDPVDDQDAVTKKYLQDRIQELQGIITELEEEINALFPTVERGMWMYDAINTFPNDGHYVTLDVNDAIDSDFNNTRKPIVTGKQWGIVH